MSIKNSLPLVLAIAIAAAVAILWIGYKIWTSSWRRLQRQRAILRSAQRELARAQKTASKAEQAFAKLKSKSDRIKPRRLSEAEETLQDLTTLLKRATERVKVAENHVRNVILQEYPPIKQDRLLKKCLPDRAPDKGPFSFN